MKLASLWARIWLVLVITVAAGLVVGVAYAHERREVGEYELVVGWTGEPAYEGQRNGVDFRVLVAATEEPVEGLQDTVQVEVIYGPTGATRVLELRPVFQQPGRYTADILPTAAGDYHFRFSGTIRGMEVDETFVPYSQGGGFNDVATSTDIQFPENMPESREIVAAIRGSQSAAQEAQGMAQDARSSASTASTLAVVGIVLGAVGIVSGIGGVMVGMRRR